MSTTTITTRVTADNSCKVGNVTTSVTFEPSQKERLMRSQHFAASQPLPNRGILLRAYDPQTGNGQIKIRVRKSSIDATRFFVRMGGIGTPVLPMPDPLNVTGLVELMDPDNDGVFGADNVNVLGIPQVAPRANNQRIQVGAYAGNGQLLESSNFGFMAIPPTTTVSVSAKGCLFFAYAGYGAPLPRAGEKLPDNFPTSVCVPMDAGNVIVSVSTGQTWNNGSTNTDAGGDVAQVNPTHPDYIHGDLFSQHFETGGPLPDNMLVGMWDYGAENVLDPNACKEMQMPFLPPLKIPLPESVPPEEVPPTFLLLGSHSDEDWSNHSGKLDVLITWS